MEAIKLRLLRAQLGSIKKAISLRANIEIFIRLKKSIEIDCYHVDDLPEEFALEMYGKLALSHTEDEIKKYVHFNECNGKMATLMAKVLRAVLDEVGQKRTKKSMNK